MVAGIDYLAIEINRPDEIDVHAAAVPLTDDGAAGVARCHTRRN